MKQKNVNVTESAKDSIKDLKDSLKLTDKEFVDVALIVFKGADQSVIDAAVETVTVEKQKQKIRNRIERIEAKLAEAKAEAEKTQGSDSEPVEDSE